jgi:hypothetical protein
MNNDDDFPELTEEMMSELKHTDLHLGPAVVRPMGRSWAEQHGPQSPGPGIRALDFLILAMFSGSIVLFVRACTWAAFG